MFKTKYPIFIFLSLFISLNAIGQTIDFKLIKAIKSKELVKEIVGESNLILESDILPEDKRYLIIIAEAISASDKSIAIKKENIKLNNDIPVLGKLQFTKRAILGWPSFSTKLKKGKNYFSAVFIVDKDLNNPELTINAQKFNITKIDDAPHTSLICPPRAVLEEKEFLEKISFENKYSRNEYQVFTKKITPASGTLLKIKITAIYYDNIEYYRNTSFVTRVDHFILEDEAGKSYSCIGKLGPGGKFSRPGNQTFQIGNKKEDISIIHRLIFNVPKKGNYKLKYLDQLILEI